MSCVFYPPFFPFHWAPMILSGWPISHRQALWLLGLKAVFFLHGLCWVSACYWQLGSSDVAAISSQSSKHAPRVKGVVTFKSSITVFMEVTKVPSYGRWMVPFINVNINHQQIWYWGCMLTFSWVHINVEEWNNYFFFQHNSAYEDYISNIPNDSNQI